jgi:hypothetical protein
MNVAAQIKEHAAKSEHPASVDPELCRIVLQELERVQASRFFKNSQRSRQFLEYIVTRKLAGHGEELKERTIGTELFQRPANYATGDDPVVRVQAGEVRRRLEQFYQAEPERPIVRIELAVGSYAPQFHLPSSEPVEKPEPHQPLQQGIVAAVSILQHKMLVTSVVVLCVLIALAAVVYGVRAHSIAKQANVTEQFWAPALASQQPVLICLAKPVVYRPTLELYQKYSSNHPGSFSTEVERSNKVLPLDPQSPLVWSEMVPYPDYGAAAGDVEAAVSMSALLGKLSKPTQVRIGEHYTFEDLRNSPSAVIGAFNNKWTMQITAGLHFRFVEDNGAYSIRENAPGGRSWVPKTGKNQQTEQDYAIVARLLDSNTGQFTIVAAGILGNGTQAAGEFVSRPALLEKALRAVPVGWQNKNLEFILRTDITDTIAGPPSVVAYYSW